MKVQKTAVTPSKIPQEKTKTCGCSSKPIYMNDKKPKKSNK